jgi:hypothetical protein
MQGICRLIIIKIRKMQIEMFVKSEFVCYNRKEQT